MTFFVKTWSNSRTTPLQNHSKLILNQFQGLTLSTPSLVLKNCAADLGVLISGGYDGREYLQSVEIYNPASNTTCSLHNLPMAVLRHSQQSASIWLVLTFYYNGLYFILNIFRWSC